MPRARPRLKLLGALLMTAACDVDRGAALDGRDAGAGARDPETRDGGRPDGGGPDAVGTDARNPDPDPSGWCERDAGWPQREPAIPPFPLDGPSLGPVDTEPDLPSPTVAGALIEPPDLGFGGVTVGQTATVTVEIVAVEPGTYAVASPAACPAVGPFCARFTSEALEAGDRYVFDVAYRPTAPAGRDRASVEVTSDGAATRTIPVDGTALDRPAVDCWAPTRLDPLAPGEVVTFEVRCINAGLGPAVMTDLVVETDAAYLLVSDAPLPRPTAPRILDDEHAAWTFELRPDANAREVEVRLRWRGAVGRRERSAGSHTMRVEVVPGRLEVPEAVMVFVRSTGREAGFELKNVGLGPVRIDAVEVDGPFEVRTDPFPSELNGGERAWIRVAVSPVEAALDPLKVGELRIVSTSGDSPTVVRLEMDVPGPGPCALNVPGYTDLGKIRPPEAFGFGDRDRRDHEMIIGVKNVGDGPCIVDVETFGFIAGVKGVATPEALEPPVSTASMLLFPGQVDFLRLAPRVGLPLGPHVGRVELTPRGDPAARAVVRFGAELTRLGARVRTEPTRPWGCLRMTTHAVQVLGVGVRSVAWAGSASEEVTVRVQEELPGDHRVQITVARDRATPMLRGELHVETTVGRLRVPLTFGRLPDGRPPQVDQFPALGRPKVDVLWIVDDSPSMARWHPNLARNLMEFVRIADAQAFDYRLLLARTSSAELVPLGPNGRRFLTPDDSAQDRGAFVEAAIGRPEATAAATGSGRERSINAALRAITNARGVELRQDAPLSVVVVSDDDDASAASVDAAWDALRAVKGVRNPSLFSFSAIAGRSSGCRAGEATVPATERLHELVRRAGGASAYLCTPDWSRSLEGGGAEPRLRWRYFLTSEPAPESIRVQIGSDPVPASCSSGRVNWAYDFSTNSVNFTPNAAPPPGSQVRIEYQPECL